MVNVEGKILCERERIKPMLNPANDLVFTVEMKKRILRESSRETQRAKRAGEVSQHIIQRW